MGRKLGMTEKKIFLNVDKWCPLFGEIQRIQAEPGSTRTFWANECENVIRASRMMWSTNNKTSPNPRYIEKNFSLNSIKSIKDVFLIGAPFADLKNPAELEETTRLLLEGHRRDRNEADDVLEPFRENRTSENEGYRYFQPFKLYSLIAIAQAWDALKDLLVYDVRALEEKGIQKNEFEKTVRGKISEAREYYEGAILDIFMDVECWCPLHGTLPKVPEDHPRLHVVKKAEKIIRESREYLGVLDYYPDPNCLARESDFIKVIFWHGATILNYMRKGYMGLEEAIDNLVENHKEGSHRKHSEQLQSEDEKDSKKFIQERTPIVIDFPGFQSAVEVINESKPYRIFALLAISEAHSLLSGLLSTQKIRNEEISESILSATELLSECRETYIQELLKNPIMQYPKIAKLAADQHNWNENRQRHINEYSLATKERDKEIFGIADRLWKEEGHTSKDGIAKEISDIFEQRRKEIRKQFGKEKSPGEWVSTAKSERIVKEQKLKIAEGTIKNILIKWDPPISEI